MSAEPCYGRSLDAAESNRIDFEDDSSALPSVKRLRLRGDWSDTGPHARPGNEQDNDDNNTSMYNHVILWIHDVTVLISWSSNV